jgi:hypothetical protein
MIPTRVQPKHRNQRLAAAKLCFLLFGENQQLRVLETASSLTIE